MWSKWKVLYDAEKAAYFRVRDEESPPNGEHVRPSQVHMAKDAWYTALDARYEEENRLAEELGIERWLVPPTMLARVMHDKEEVKRVWSSQSR